MRAVRAAFEMKERLVEVNEMLHANYGVRLENRTGVNTGEVVAGDVSSGQRLVTGDTVNTAARLEQNAPASEILIGGSTYELVRDGGLGRGGGAAPAERQGGAGARLPSARCVGPRRRVLPPTGPSDRRAGGRAASVARCVRPGGRVRPMPSRHRVRSGGHGEISPAPGVPGSRGRRRHHPQGTLPFLRRGRDLLADRGGRAGGGRDRAARQPRRGAGQARRHAARSTPTSPNASARRSGSSTRRSRSRRRSGRCAVRWRSPPRIARWSCWWTTSTGPNEPCSTCSAMLSTSARLRCCCSAPPAASWSRNIRSGSRSARGPAPSRSSRSPPTRAPG